MHEVRRKGVVQGWVPKSVRKSAPQAKTATGEICSRPLDAIASLPCRRLQPEQRIFYPTLGQAELDLVR